MKRPHRYQRRKVIIPEVTENFTLADIDPLLAALEADFMSNKKATGPKSQCIRAMAPTTWKAALTFYIEEIRENGLLPNGNFRPDPSAVARFGALMKALKLPPEEPDFRLSETLCREARAAAKVLCGSGAIHDDWLDDISIWLDVIMKK